MPYVKRIPLVKVTLPSDPHYFVMWRSKVPYGALADARRQAVKVDSDGNPIFDANAYSDLSLLAHIESWNLDGEDKQPLPLTLESLNLLDSDDVSALQSRQAGKMEEQQQERKNS